MISMIPTQEQKDLIEKNRLEALRRKEALQKLKALEAESTNLNNQSSFSTSVSPLIDLTLLPNSSAISSNDSSSNINTSHLIDNSTSNLENNRYSSDSDDSNKFERVESKTDSTFLRIDKVGEKESGIIVGDSTSEQEQSDISLHPSKKKQRIGGGPGSRGGPGARKRAKEEMAQKNKTDLLALQIEYKEIYEELNFCKSEIERLKRADLSKTCASDKILLDKDVLTKLQSEKIKLEKSDKLFAENSELRDLNKALQATIKDLQNRNDSFSSSSSSSSSVATPAPTLSPNFNEKELDVSKLPRVNDALNLDELKKECIVRSIHHSMLSVTGATKGQFKKEYTKSKLISELGQGSIALSLCPQFKQVEEIKLRIKNDAAAIRKREMDDIETKAQQKEQK